jgi:hypothetical protein
VVISRGTTSFNRAEMLLALRGVSPPALEPRAQQSCVEFGKK